MNSKSRLDLYAVTLTVLNSKNKRAMLRELIERLLVTNHVTSVEVVSTCELSFYETILDSSITDAEDLELIAMIKTLFRYSEDFETLWSVIDDTMNWFIISELVDSFELNHEIYEQTCSAFKQIALSGINIRKKGNSIEYYADLFPVIQREYVLSLLSGYYNLVSSGVESFSHSNATKLLCSDDFIRVASAYSLYLLVNNAFTMAQEEIEVGSFDYNDLTSQSITKYHDFYIKCFEDRMLFKSLKINVKLESASLYKNLLSSELAFIKKLVKQNNIHVPAKKITGEPDKTLDSSIAVSNLGSSSPVKSSISDSEKIACVTSSNIVVLASKRVNLKNLRVRVEDIQTVSEEVLRQSYTAVVILTKFIGHKHSYRVKSISKSVGNPVYLVSATNNKKLLIDIYDNVFGGRGIEC